MMDPRGPRSGGERIEVAPAIALDPGLVRWGADGLVPAVVVDDADGAVLMLAWMDAEALAATTATGEVHLHSRSRDRLWRKGETSGNVLRLRSLALDCDADAILVVARPAGPTCHRGTRSCFDGEAGAASGAVSGAGGLTAPVEAPARGEDEGFAWLEVLWATIRARAAERPEGSYTVALLDGGVDAVARKVTEEATEVLIAAKDDALGGRPGGEATRASLAGESADLLYHLLVLLAERDLRPADVLEVLRARHGG